MSQTDAFLALVRAGLWEDVVKVNGFSQNDFDSAELKAVPKGQADGLKVNDLHDAIDYDEVLRLAEEQSVLGLVATGVERFTACGIPITEKLTLLGKCQLIEQQNLAMNQFVAKLVAQMRQAGIDVVLVKGQGVAQCYERPLWRSCGDVDFLLDEENYEKAKAFLKPFASSVDKESVYNRHLGTTISGYSVELHGNLRCGLSKRMDNVIDEIQHEVCFQEKRRTWQNGNVTISLPAPGEDAIFIFTHILKHFYKGGLGLRQICDWCRLLWVQRATIDVALLEERLQKMRLITEWKGFAAFAVEDLGMPKETMPLYDSADKWKRKASQILEFILISGNFGHNRDMSYFSKYPYLIRKAISLKQRMGDLVNHARIFPINTIRFSPSIVGHGLRSAINGE